MSKDKVEIYWAGRYNYEKEWGIISHSHAFYQLNYILSGSTEYCFDNSSYRIDEDTLIFIPPNVIHEMPAVTKGNVYILDIKFNVYDDFLINRLPIINGPKKIFNQTIKKNIDIIVSEGKQKDILFRELSNTLLEHLLLLAIRENSIKNPIQKEYLFQNGTTANTETSEVTKAIVEYINVNYMKKISLDVLSHSLGYSANYICEKFSNEVKVTMKYYLNNYRIEKAKEYLSSSSIDLKHICSLIGFSDIHYFSLVFKNHTGLSPGQFKKQALQEYQKAVVFEKEYNNIDFRHHFSNSELA